MSSSLSLTFSAPSLPAVLQSLDQLGRARVPAWLLLTPVLERVLPESLPAMGYLAHQPIVLPRTLHHVRFVPEDALTEPGFPLPEGWIAVVPGAPREGQRILFRTLFTQTNPDALWSVFRADRLPGTTLPEADLGYWLHQTHAGRALYDINVLHLEAGAAALRERLRVAQSDPEPATVLFDTLTDTHLEQLAAFFWQEKPAAVLGSGAILEALAKKHAQATVAPAVATVDAILAVSGSPSPTTQEQIDAARASGYFCHTFRDEKRTVRVTTTALAVGHSAVVYSQQPGETAALARAVGQILATHPVPRLVVCGSETFLALAAELEMVALEFLAPLVPGAPLCRVIGGPLEGREVVVQPGQLGDPAFFLVARQGQS